MFNLINHITPLSEATMSDAFEVNVLRSSFYVMLCCVVLCCNLSHTRHSYTVHVTLDTSESFDFSVFYSKSSNHHSCLGYSQGREPNSKLVISVVDSSVSAADSSFIQQLTFLLFSLSFSFFFMYHNKRKFLHKRA